MTTTKTRALKSTVTLTPDKTRINCHNNHNDFSHTGPVPSFPMKQNIQDINLDGLKERFDKQLPKYGHLWRSMVNAQLEKKGYAETVDNDKKFSEGKENTSPPSQSKLVVQRRREKEAKHSNDKNEEFPVKPATTLLDAIFSKQRVTLRAPTRSSNHLGLCGEDKCDCSEPVVEIMDDEDASVYDVNIDDELADSTDDESLVVKSGSTTIKHSGPTGEADHDTNLSIIDKDSDDEESILIVTRTPKKKMYIIESEEEDIDEEQQHDDSDESSKKCRGNNDESSKSISTYGISSSTSSTRQSSRVLKSKPIVDDFVDSDDGSDEEKEWLEISFTDKDDGLSSSRPNTIVILSDDEDETESDEDDEQSAFTISDDSEISDQSSIPIRKRGGSATILDNTVKSINISKAKNSSQRITSNSRTKFRKEISAITSRTFAEFNELAFNNKLSSVEVKWSNKLNTTAGITRMRGKLGEKNAHTRVATIELATKVIDDEERLRATLLHEMCHAAQWLLDGIHKPPHGSSFKKWASLASRVVGDVEVTTTHDYHIVYKYAWACSAQNCNVIIKRHSRSVDPNKNCCGRCQGKLIEIEVPGKGDSANDTGYTEKKVRKTSEFAIFVKDQSANVRNSLAKELKCSPKKVTQSDVMKECGKLWRNRKDTHSTSAKDEGVSELNTIEDKLANMFL